MPHHAHDHTLIAHAGSRPADQRGAVNPPVYHASTVLFPTIAAYEEGIRRADDPGVFAYGRYGTPTSHALQEAVARLEGADQALAVSSGQGAIACVLLALLGAGDHLLMVDSCYGPARKLCRTLLPRLGIDVTYYDPLIGADVANLIRPNTKVVYVESPGSVTFEVQDIPAIAAAAHAGGAIVVMDNTWATPLFFKAVEHGVDVSIHSATKYVAGHADAMLGLILMRQSCYAAIRGTVTNLGQSPAPDDCYLALRGLRTLAVRLARHQDTALRLARWLVDRPEVTRVLHPGLPHDPGHALWRRDFRGSTGLFSIVLKPCRPEALAAMLDGMTYFGMGVSWGGFESLILPIDPAPMRTATRWTAEGPLVRIHAGLEDPADLMADLDAGFDRLNAANRR